MDWDSLYCEDIDQHCTQWQDNGRICTCQLWNSASQQKFFHPNAVTDHGSTSLYPSLFEGKMQHSKELKMSTRQGYECTTSVLGTE